MQCRLRWLVASRLGASGSGSVGVTFLARHEDGACAGGLRLTPRLLDFCERDLARLDLDRPRVDLRHERRQLGNVASRRYGALPVALDAEVGRSKRHGWQLDRGPRHGADLYPVHGPAAV